SQSVRVGERWNAAGYAVQELTDLDKIDEGTVSCQFEQLTTQEGRKQARIIFSGTVKGVGEDGPTRHTLSGYLHYDLQSKMIGYLSGQGGQQMLDKDGKMVGSVEGTFVLSRRPDSCKDLSDESLRPLKLEPNDDNTQLLYVNSELGVRFLHPRNWRIA